jgi:hypothetical protein
MLCVRYEHMTIGQAYAQETNPSSRQRGCYRRTITARVQLQKQISGREHIPVYSLVWSATEVTAKLSGARVHGGRSLIQWPNALQVSRRHSRI